MKKILSLVLAFFMLFSLLTVVGCDDQSSDKGNTDPQASDAVNTQNGGKVENGNGDGNVTDNEVYTRDGDTIYFGQYPQTEVKSESLIATLNGKAGTLPTSANAQNWTSYGYYLNNTVSNFMWYIDVEDGADRYRGVYFTDYRAYYTDGNASNQSYNGYTTGTVYWFKYEPIAWTVLQEEGDTALILCSMVIDAQAYQNEIEEKSGKFYIKGTSIYANNYAESTIRAWLNDNFYNTAFNDLQKALIIATTIDNGLESTGETSSSYTCQNTEDKIFLLSYQDVINMESSVRLRKNTDYAKSQGAFTSSGENSGSNWWWLRTPANKFNGKTAKYVNESGNVQNQLVVYGTDSGVVPALQIKLK